MKIRLLTRDEVLNGTEESVLVHQVSMCGWFLAAGIEFEHPYNQINKDCFRVQFCDQRPGHQGFTNLFPSRPHYGSGHSSFHPQANPPVCW